MSTVAFHTLGCKVNHYETEALWQLFKEDGYERKDFEQHADVYIINTCTVTNTSDKKSRQIIRRAIRQNPDSIICVTGCYAQTSAAEVMDIPGVDIVIGTQQRQDLMHYIENYQQQRQPVNVVQNIMKTRVFEELDVPDFTDRTRASLKIQEGCNNFCAFCIIPWARGLMRSRQPKEVIRQAQQLVDAGYIEIILTGIHTGGYGQDLENYNLAQLLRDIEIEVQGLKRLRISSIEASQLSDEVMEVIAQSAIIVEHLHIPIQSASNEVLKRMKRKYTAGFFEERIQKLQQNIPQLALTTDVIVGFPGETEEEFMETYHFIEKNQFSELHVFPYSKRTGTPAAKMENQIDEQVKNERVNRLLQLNQHLANDYSRKFVGATLDVIPEGLVKEGVHQGKLIGHSGNYLKIVFDGEREFLGKLVRIEITAEGYPYTEGNFQHIVESSAVT